MSDYDDEAIAFHDLDEDFDPFADIAGLGKEEDDFGEELDEDGLPKRKPRNPDDYSGEDIL